jgi:uncharacterized repeat protein (TIGR01451 family)
MFIFMLVAQLLSPFRAGAVDGAEGLILTLEASKTVVAAGEEFSYIINYSASSTVSNFTDPNITFVMPEGVTYTGKADNGNTTSTVGDSVAFPGRKEVVFAFKNGELPAGSAGRLVVKGKFENYVTPDGTAATVKSTYHANVNGTPVEVESNDVTVQATADATWTIEKKKIRPVPEPFKGSEVQYEIVFRDLAPAANGKLSINDITVTDKLPEGAIFVAADNGGAPGPDNTVVWHLADDLRDSKRLAVIVNYPDSITDTEVTNQASATYTPVGKAPATVTAQVKHGFAATPIDLGSRISKGTNSGQREISPGQTVKFYLASMENKANVALTSGVIEDMTPTKTENGLPIDFQLQKIKTAAFTGISNFDVYYTLVANPTGADWTFWKNVDASAPTSLDPTALGKVMGVQFRVATLPIDFIQTEPFEMTYKVPETFAVPADSTETVRNNVTFDYKFNGLSKKASSYSYVDIVSDRPLLKLEKTSSKTSLIPRETTTYTLKVTNDQYASSDKLTNPTIVDMLPAELEYQPNTWKITKPAGMGADPMFTAVPQADGTTQLTWAWDDANPGNLQIGETFSISFDAKVKIGTKQQSIANHFQVRTPGYLNDNKFNNKKCPTCSNNGVYSVDQLVDVTINEDVALQSEMWVKGELDSDWSKFPASGLTAPGGSAMYRLKILNVGNVATNKLTILNTFARIGDSAVLNGSVGRGSQWGPLLTGPVVVPSYVKAYYSTTPGVTMNTTTGVDNGVWSLVPPQDLTAVTAVKFVFDDDYVIDPLDSMSFEWPMVAPVGAPTGGEVAWNSFGYKMERAGGGSILPSEPLKIGIKIQASPKAEIGNYVWLDQNENGRQDAGEQGVNGVKAELYNEAGTKLSETLSGNDFNGNPGYFLFPNLDAGKYSIVFRPSAAYEGVTAAGQGADAEKDSDANPATGSTALITVADGEKKHEIDAGLVLKKAVLGDYVWLDANGNGVQDAAETGVNGVKAELYDGGGLLVASTTTAAHNGKDGYYAFGKLNPGTYRVKFELPSSAYGFVTPHLGGNATLDADVNPATGYSDAVTLAQGEENLSLDAGIALLPLGSIGDTVWIDANRNGVQDPTEKGLNQVKVQLYNEQNQLIAQTVTADRAGVPGSYSFENLTTGKYYVKFIAPYPFTKKQAGPLVDKDSDADATGQTDLVTLLPGGNITTLDAGVYIPKDNSLPAAPKGSLGDRVWNDSNRNGVQDAGETGRNGVTVELYNAKNELVSTVVTADRDGKPGMYLFTDLPQGEYRLKFTAPAGYKLTAAEAGVDLQTDSNPDATGWTKTIFLGAGETDLTVDAGFVQADDPTTPVPPVDPGTPDPVDPAPVTPGPVTPVPGTPDPVGPGPVAPAPATEQKPARSASQQLPQTGEQEPALPLAGWALILVAGGMLAIRKFAKK